MLQFKADVQCTLYFLFWTRQDVDLVGLIFPDLHIVTYTVTTIWSLIRFWIRTEVDLRAQCSSSQHYKLNLLLKMCSAS